MFQEKIPIVLPPISSKFVISIDFGPLDLLTFAIKHDLDEPITAFGPYGLTQLANVKPNKEALSKKKKPYKI